MKTSLDRRTVLRGAGGIALSLPFLGAMGLSSAARAQSAIPPKRFVVFFTPIGTLPSLFWPAGTGPAFTLNPSSILASLEPLKSELLLLRGLDMASAYQSAGAGHPRGMGNLLTSVPLEPGQFNTGAGQTVGWGRGISVDQRIANVIGTTTKYRSLEFGVQVRPPTTNSVLSYRGDALPLAPENDPAKNFTRLFGDLGTGDQAAAALRAQRKSVLDAVKDDFQRLNPRLGTEDRQKLAEHLESVREVERQVTSVPDGTCTAPTITPVANFMADANMPAAADAQMKLLTMALKCDLTRVASLQFSNGTSDKTFPWLSIPDSHHALSHEGPSNTAAMTKLAKIYTWYASQFARFVQMLKDTSDSDGSSLLSNTVVLWCTELTQGNTHSYKELPIILAGRAGGAIKPGRLLRYNGVSHSNLHVSLLNAMGVADTKFGDPAFCTGPLSGLT